MPEAETYKAKEATSAQEESDALGTPSPEVDVRNAQSTISIAAEVRSAPAGVLTVQSSTVYAVVRADGTLARGFGGPASFRESVGSYVVYFLVTLDRGAFVATIGNPDTDSSFTPPGFIIVNRVGATTNGVRVVTRDTAGTRADRPFHLAVHFLDQ